jgi:hypothetical protein
MPKVVTKYQCYYCTKSWVSLSRAEKHENECLRNPAVKSCSTCRNAITYLPDSPPWCNALNKPIFVPGVQVRSCGAWFDSEFNDDIGV